jgi:hypothetical protein
MRDRDFAGLETVFVDDMFLGCKDEPERDGVAGQFVL